MKNTILYGVVIRFDNGGQNMNSFLVKESAENEVKKVINLLKNSNKKGISVYLSELEYDYYNNKIISNELINNESKLCFVS